MRHAGGGGGYYMDVDIEAGTAWVAAWRQGEKAAPAAVDLAVITAAILNFYTDFNKLFPELGIPCAMWQGLYDAGTPDIWLSLAPGHLSRACCGA